MKNAIKTFINKKDHLKIAGALWIFGLILTIILGHGGNVMVYMIFGSWLIGTYGFVMETLRDQKTHLIIK